MNIVVVPGVARSVVYARERLPVMGCQGCGAVRGDPLVGGGAQLLVLRVEHACHERQRAWKSAFPVVLSGGLTDAPGRAHQRGGRIERNGGGRLIVVMLPARAATTE